MLSSLRKFSGSIYAKILLAIIVIPFVFWGMGSSLTGGDKNIIATIDNEKYSVQDFGNFIQKYTNQTQGISSSQIENFLSVFIQDKLLELEIEEYEIKLSDSSLSELIKNQNEFKRGNLFSRVEYEKFLLENNVNTISFESNIALQEKKSQLINIISGGIITPDFLINSSYNKTYHKRYVELINLNNFFEKEIIFTEDEINKYYENNKDNYKEIYKSINLIQITAKKLIGEDKVNDEFFKRIDEIDNLIIQGEDIKLIIEKFNLGLLNNFTINRFGENENYQLIDSIPPELSIKIFNDEISETLNLIELKDNFYIIEILETKELNQSILNDKFKKNIITDLKNSAKRKFLTEIISKINKNDYKKSDFNNFSKEKKLPIEKLALSSSLDFKKLKKELVREIYSAPKKKVVVIHDINLKENYLVYVDKIEKAKIDKESDAYENHLSFSKNELANELLSSYDTYIKKKYKIDVNYKALERVKNYFN